LWRQRSSRPQLARDDDDDRLIVIIVLMGQAHEKENINVSVLWTLFVS